MDDLGLVVWLVLFFGWLLLAAVSGSQLERHGKFGSGFAWGLFFGPLGALIAVAIAANLDREKSDKETRELLRNAFVTREQETTRAVVAALAAHLASEQPPNAGDAHTVAAAPAPTEPTESAPPPPRSYEEIITSEPQRSPRRFR